LKCGILGLLGAFSGGMGRIFGFEMERGLQSSGEAKSPEKEGINRIAKKMPLISFPWISLLCRQSISLDSFFQFIPQPDGIRVGNCFFYDNVHGARILSVICFIGILSSFPQSIGGY